MKIRIKNIFVNKKKKEKRVEDESSNLKIVYDANNIEDITGLNITSKEKLKEKESKKEDKNEINEKENENTKRRRKGYYSLEETLNTAPKIKEDKKTTEEINEEKKSKESLEEKQKNFKLYYNNLVKNKNKLSRGYYILFLGMFLLGSLSVRFAYKTYKLYNSENYKTFGKEEGDSKESVAAFSNSDEKSDIQIEENKEEESKEEIKGNLQDVNTNNNDTKVQEEKKTETKKVASTSTKKEQKVTPLSFVKAVDGEVLKIFSNDKVIYSKTLELWKTHDGVDYKAEEGEYVKAVERGTIEKIYEDSFFGVTIVIDHGQGYKSSYSNLEKDTLVKEKQTITKSQKIGKIGKTAIGEIKDESHLHFMLFKDNVSIDPTSLLK